LNNFPEDKYAAVLQAHLTGKALKVFTELSVAECQHYPTLKAALLAAYSVVPEVYRKRFRCLSLKPCRKLLDLLTSTWLYIKLIGLVTNHLIQGLNLFVVVIMV